MGGVSGVLDGVGKVRLMEVDEGEVGGGVGDLLRARLGLGFGLGLGQGQG